MCSFADDLAETPGTVVMNVPQDFDDDADYWLFKVTEVVALDRQAEDSVGQKVKKGDAMLRGHFYEVLPSYVDKESKKRRYYFTASVKRGALK
jgi:hypothetical protein